MKVMYTPVKFQHLVDIPKKMAKIEGRMIQSGDNKQV